MTTEEFNKLVAQCQPHKVFKTDWKTFYSIDFAHTMLPNIIGIEGKAMLMYDGADFFKKLEKTDSKVLQLTKGIELISLVSYTYPKGVDAEKKKGNVVVGEHEICTFIEVSKDDKIDIFFKFGNDFKKFLSEYFESKKLPDVTKDIDKKVYKTTTVEFKKYFNNSITHYSMMAFIGKTIAVDLVAVNDKVAFKVKIDKVRVKTSEPSDNKNRKVKVKKQQYLIVDFEIQNQPAINYTLSIFKNKAKVFEKIISPKETPNSNKKSDTKTTPPLHKTGKHETVVDCTGTTILENKNETDKLTIKIHATNEKKQTANAQKDVILKTVLEDKEVDNFIIVNETKILSSQIIERQKIIKNLIPKNEYLKLTKEEQLIIDLPIIMVKLGWLYSAYCQLHWLEGSGKEIYLPIQFVLNYERTIKKYKQMTSDFTNIEYASYIDETNYYPNLNFNDSSNRFLYNFEWKKIKEAYQKAINFINEISDFKEYDFGNLDFNEEAPKMNFVKAYAIGSELFGSAIGDFDDLGGCGGRIGLRVYVLGIIQKQDYNLQNLKLFFLNIKKVGFRFFDEFSFGEKKTDGTFENQKLGAWKYDINNPEIPNRYGWQRSNWFNLENSTYRKLLERKKIGLNPKKFDIQTQIQTLKVPNEIKVIQKIPFYI